MKKAKINFIFVLVLYYGIIQLLHLIFLIRAGIILVSEKRFTFPASPPPNGWSTQAKYFLIGMSIFDSANISLTFIFVYAYLTSKEWYNWVGLINLAAMMSSAAIYSLGTFPSGAWFAHPFEYFLIAVLFLPVILLFILIIFHNVKKLNY